MMLEFVQQSFSGYLQFSFMMSKVDYWLLLLRERQAVTKSKTKKPFVTFKDRHDDITISQVVLQLSKVSTYLQIIGFFLVCST